MFGVGKQGMAAFAVTTILTRDVVNEVSKTENRVSLSLEI
jgi:hypothetical protein